jgi:hypothetical protein
MKRWQKQKRQKRWQYAAGRKGKDTRKTKKHGRSPLLSWRSSIVPTPQLTKGAMATMGVMKGLPLPR